MPFLMVRELSIVLWCIDLYVTKDLQYLFICLVAIAMAFHRREIQKEIQKESWASENTPKCVSWELKSSILIINIWITEFMKMKTPS